LRALRDVDINDLPHTEYYLVFYWSMNYDNLAFRHMRALLKAQERADLSLTILFVNVDNLEGYGMDPEAYLSFVVEHRTKKLDLKDRRWVQSE
jgi:hypothetical protein